MKKKSRIAHPIPQHDSPVRHLPLVDLLVDTRTELFELAMRSGLRVFTTMLEEDRTAICGPRYAHQPDQPASRAGTAPSEVALGGRKVAIQRPRVRTADGEVALPTFQTMAVTDPLDRRVVEQMLVGVATRQYARSLEPLAADVTSRGTSKSAVSRRFVAKTRAQLETWQAVALDHLDLVGLLLDGVHVGEHCLIVALRDRSLLVILDGSKALRKAVRDTFGDVALVQRCQIHKLRNVLDHLPERQRPWVKAILQRAYRSADAATASRLLHDLARRLEVAHPSAAASVREGLNETLTIMALGLSESLRRSLSSTNAAESLISRTRHVKRNVKRWRGGLMVLRWVAAGVIEAVKGFRRLRGHKDMPKLVAALRARDQQLGLVENVENVA